MADSGVARVSAVLTAFTARHAELTVSDIARRTGLPKSTTSRLVAELVAHGFLVREGSLLHMGTRLFEFGELASRHRDLRAVALPHMADLREAGIVIELAEAHALLTAARARADAPDHLRGQQQ